MQITVQTHAEAKSPKCLVGGKPKGYHSEETDKSDARQPMAGTWDFFAFRCLFRYREWYGLLGSGG